MSENIAKVNVTIDEQKIIDNIGFKVNVSELPEVKSLRRVQYRLYGGNFIVRFFKKIYYFFSPYKKMVLEKVIDSLTRISIQAVANTITEAEIE